MNNLEKEGNVSSEILGAIDLIIKHMPHAIFGGSIALNAINLIDRPVKDIDLFFIKGDSLDYCRGRESGFWKMFTENGDTTVESDTVTDMNGEPIQRTSVKIKGVNTCCFKVSQEELQHSKVKFLGREICIQNVNYVLQAKQCYAEKNPKHKEDIENSMKVISDLIDDLPW
jgi:hypothetical protein